MYYVLVSFIVFSIPTVFSLSLSMSNKMFSPSVGRNKAPISEVLQPKLTKLSGDDGKLVRCIEVAGGTGEHAALLCKELSFLRIYPVEPNIETHASMRAWSAEVNEARGEEVILSPCSKSIIDLKIPQDLPMEWKVDSQVEEIPICLLCINMIHISVYEATEALFRVGKEVGARYIYTYGPYRVDGSMVESNQRFDESLKSRNTEWGVRDIEKVAESAAEHGQFRLVDKVEMPANNLLLTWEREIDK